MKVDGVFSGGGIKAYALLGALEAVENKGITFHNVVGTSAGAIISAFIVAGYSGKEMIEMVNDLDTEALLDPRQTLLPTAFTKWISIYWRMGLYKGDMLELWIKEKLAAKGVHTFGELPEGVLKVIASDITSSKIVVLPDDLDDYGMNKETFSVAKAVRMSASIPYFFEPMKLYSRTGEKSYIVDGGVLSNFPIWLYEQKNMKTRPILGFKLSPSLKNMPKRKIHNAFDMFNALFETMKDAHDARYISKEIEKHIIFLPVDNILATEFNLSPEKKKSLLQLGERRAEQFLKKWSY